MKRLIIIGEGQTEQAFCEEILRPHFYSHDIQIESPTISKTGGGIVAWHHLKDDIMRYLSRPDVYVTLLIDYYGIQDKHAFPEWENAKQIPPRPGLANRMDHLEQGMATDIPDAVRYRFIPYIQLHEFEALLFANKEVFDRSFTANEFEDYDYLNETITAFPNPEDINDGTETAPSKRLERILTNYTSHKPSTKALWGPLLADAIGLKVIRNKCPRFNAWIETLENI
ncbi:DUF4276 family protein [Marinoscillum sp. 108]|uniref:DUF4276 family protein n=1 Tax=Marinoscillum sp. 108 TaxID=2653151 RepID=UPI0012EFF230|nr:DUF4276 family protein [Marinoscillum sp. 108]VXD20874.1 conserved hypothetical protein [Marinoscillum sp. 108]